MILMQLTKPSKMYLDMNVHYLELIQHLELLGTSPRLLPDPSIQVFQSEPRLYGKTLIIEFTRIHLEFDLVCTATMTLVNHVLSYQLKKH